MRLARCFLFAPLAVVLCSAAFLAKDRPPVEIAYTQDGANCVRGRVTDQAKHPVAGARVTLLFEKSLTGIAVTETDPKGNFTFRSVPFKEDLMVMVEADGYAKATAPGVVITPPYSCVVLFRLPRTVAGEPPSTNK